MGAPNEGQAPVQINLLELLETLNEEQYLNATVVLEEEGVFKENEITNDLTQAKVDVNKVPSQTQMRIKQMFCDGKFVEKEYGEEEVKPADDAGQKPEGKKEDQAEQQTPADKSQEETKEIDEGLRDTIAPPQIEPKIDETPTKQEPDVSAVQKEENTKPKASSTIKATPKDKKPVTEPASKRPLTASVGMKMKSNFKKYLVQDSKKQQSAKKIEPAKQLSASKSTYSSNNFGGKPAKTSSLSTTQSKLKPAMIKSQNIALSTSRLPANASSPKSSKDTKHKVDRKISQIEQRLVSAKKVPARPATAARTDESKRQADIEALKRDFEKFKVKEFAAMLNRISVFEKRLEALAGPAEKDEKKE